MHDQVYTLFLDESCDHIVDMEGEYLSLSLKKHEENRFIFEV